MPSRSPHFNSKDPLKDERRAARERAVKGFSSSPEVLDEVAALEAWLVDIALPAANGRRRSSVIGLEDVRRTVAAVAWLGRPWAYAENTFSGPLHALALAAQVEGHVMVGVAALARLSGPEAAWPWAFEGWVHRAIDPTFTLIDPDSPLNVVKTTIAPTPTENEKLEDQQSAEIVDWHRRRSPDTPGRMTYAAHERAIKEWMFNTAHLDDRRLVSLDAAKVFSRPEAEPSPLDLAKAWDEAISAYNATERRDPMEDRIRAAAQHIADAGLPDLTYEMLPRIAAYQELSFNWNEKPASWKRERVVEAFRIAAELRPYGTSK